MINDIPYYINSYGKGPCDALMTNYYAHHSYFSIKQLFNHYHRLTRSMLTLKLLKNKANRHKSRALSNRFPTDRRTDGPTKNI